MKERALCFTSPPAPPALPGDDARRLYALDDLAPDESSLDDSGGPPAWVGEALAPMAATLAPMAAAAVAAAGADATRQLAALFATNATTTSDATGVATHLHAAAVAETVASLEAVADDDDDDAHVASRWAPGPWNGRVAPAAAAARRRRLKGGGGNGGFDDGRVVWMNPPYGSFDDFASSMLTLYVMTTGDGWELVMFSGMDGTDPELAPLRNDSAGSAIFFILWMFIGSFFALNLFVGVIIDNFNRIKAANDGSATMTQGQAQWVETMKTMSNQTAGRVAKKPGSYLGGKCFELINSTPFDLFITGVIIANVATMACDYWGIEHDAYNNALYNNAMTTYSYIYYVEFVFKITGLGPKQYFADPWRGMAKVAVVARPQLATVSSSGCI